ncbi:MAG: hypothetical protein WAV04_03015 [Candidatus Microsaccharimonas sp.]
MEAPQTYEDIKRNALRFAANTWRRYQTYAKRYMRKYGRTSSTPRPEAYFDNRILEDTYAMQGGSNPLPYGKKIEPRQKLADSILAYRSSLPDPSMFDEHYTGSLGRRMPGYKVTISKALSASRAVHEKDSIRTFVEKAS